MDLHLQLINRSREYDQFPIFTISPTPVNKHTLGGFFQLSPFFETNQEYEVYTDPKSENLKGEALFHIIIKYAGGTNRQHVLGLYYVVGQLSQQQLQQENQLVQNVLQQPLATANQNGTTGSSTSIASSALINTPIGPTPEEEHQALLREMEKNPNKIYPNKANALMPGLAWPLPDLHHSMSAHMLNSTHGLQIIYDQLRMAVSLHYNSLKEGERFVSSLHYVETKRMLARLQNESNGTTQPSIEDKSKQNDHDIVDNNNTKDNQQVTREHVAKSYFAPPNDWMMQIAAKTVQQYDFDEYEALLEQC